VKNDGRTPRRPWKCVGSEPAGDFRIFSIRRDRVVNPRTGNPHDFYILDSGSWINMIALTEDGRILLVEQYRHGTAEVTLEIPGGGVDPGDPSPLAAAQRELLEETGYVSDRWSELGVVHPNPAIQSNSCFVFLAEGCRRVGEPQPEQGEDIAVRELPVDQVRGLLASGGIRHALVVAAFALWEWKRSGRGQAGGSGDSP
jgi:ADP-ribose diphosphatase